jgi:hypothetical protein
MMSTSKIYGTKKYLATKKAEKTLHIWVEAGWVIVKTNLYLFNA